MYCNRIYKSLFCQVKLGLLSVPLVFCPLFLKVILIQWTFVPTLQLSKQWLSNAEYESIILLGAGL